MISIGGQEHVAAFARPDVFQAGIRTENWPEREGLTIRPHDEILGNNTAVDVGLVAAGLTIELGGQVTEFEKNRLIRIQGESKLARADVSIILNDKADESGTTVEYTILVEGRKLHIRLAEVAVHKFLNIAVPRFVGDYKQNVENYLQTNLRSAS